MKRKLTFLIMLLHCLASYTQTMRDVVYLKNGSIIKGAVVEFNFEESIKIQTADGSLFVYPASEVSKLTKEVQEVQGGQSELRGKDEDPIIKPTKYQGKFNLDSINAVPVNPLGITQLKRFDKKGFYVIEGDPLILLKQGKTATYEINYSHLIITDGSQRDDFEQWLTDNDEVEGWEENKKRWERAFQDNFNHEITGIRLSSNSKQLHLILHLNLVDFGAGAKYSLTKGVHGGEANADGAIEVIDKTTGKTLMILLFKGLKGEDSFKRMGRIEGLFENLGEKLSSFLKKYESNNKSDVVSSFQSSRSRYSSIIKLKKVYSFIQNVEIVSIENDSVKYRGRDMQIHYIPYKSIEEIRYAMTLDTAVPPFPCKGALSESDDLLGAVPVTFYSIEDGYISYQKVHYPYTISTKESSLFREIRLLDAEATKRYGFKVYYYLR